MFFARPYLAAGLMGLLAVAATGSNDANAQQIFRIVGPDGRVTFSDQPPLQPGANAQPASTVPIPPSSPSDGGNLPFELRQVTARYPVTLYTSPDCVPCGSGRTMLSARGVPFTEKTVNTTEDIEALKRLVGSATVPFLTIGGQQLKGFAEVDWVQYLDAAGYPKTSQLPAGYSAAPATPLVAAHQPVAPARPQAAQTPRTATPEPAAQPAEIPSGIRF